MENRLSPHSGHSDAPFDFTGSLPAFHGVPVEHQTITIAGKRFELAGLKDAADLLDIPDFAERFVKDDMAPYGFELWPAAPMLATHMLTGDNGAGRSAIELGCGLALVAMAAYSRGWNILATDYDDAALRFARHNAAHNHVPLSFGILDWRQPQTIGRFDRVLGADVLYQLVDHQPILDRLHDLLAPGGIALLADPYRGIADRFEPLALQNGFEVRLLPAEPLQRGTRTIEGRIFQLQQK